jgi:stage II sporulation protein D
MRRVTVSRRSRAVAAGLTAATAVVAAGALGASSAQATAASTVISIGSTSKHLTVTSRGNGHGHGLSQYGAWGAAKEGASLTTILKHYYPGTVYTRLPGRAPNLRVKISNPSGVVTIAPASNLHVDGVTGTLPTAGIWRYRLIAGTGTGLWLQRLLTGAGHTYTTIKKGLPNGSSFWRSGAAGQRLWFPGGSSTVYGGSLRAVRATTSGAGTVYTVNVVGLNMYTAGVVPREMPSSWSRTATDAQAVAARTYAMYEKNHAGSRYYDICDTTSCQVYGGEAHYSASGALLWTDFRQAALDTMDGVVTYQGQPIFSQFSASNGGYMSDGGQPYLKAGTDGYDTAALGDPYINDTESVSVASVAKYFGFATLTRIALSRDGVGTWGGRVTKVVLTGTSNSRTALSKTIAGTDLQWALGLGTTLYTLAPAK